MYILGDNNKLLPARKCKFSELNLTERRHLQEWIADNPDSLGEELLIIQKEFAGFAETNERLDLLALDKDGRLVVIENKRDNTGKDVTWQSIKYASYCSTLSKTQLISIFADYLVRNHGIADVNSLQEAEDRIKEFLGIESSDEDGGNVWDINVGANTQRIILVAVNFQIEVTSSVQWLSKYGLDIKCIKVTPYKFENCIIVDFDQIFPQNEMKDYTVKLAEKEKEASVIVSETANRRLGFWQRFIKYNKENNGPYFNNSATRDGGLVKGLGISGISCDVIVTTKSCRSQISINLGNASKNLEIFDYLYGKKEQIQSLMTSEFPLQWDRSEDKVISRIYTEFTKSYMQESEWPEIISFLYKSSIQMINVFSDFNIQLRHIVLQK